jgi:hypothetical protein
MILGTRHNPALAVPTLLPFSSVKRHRMREFSKKTERFWPISSAMTKALAESDIRFLEYRLEVVGDWPASPRKHAATEAISRRLASIARSALARPGVDDLVALSCRLLDDVFMRED